MMIGATTQFQSASTHKDPLHVTAHFLRPVSIGPVEIHVRRLRNGKAFTNLTAELVQENGIRTTSHFIYAAIASDELPAGDPLPLHAPAPHARWTPFRVLPSRSDPLKWLDGINFPHHVTLSRDTSVAGHHERLTRAGEGPGGVEEGRWFELRAGERISPAFLPLVCDVIPGILPTAVNQPSERHPTLTMSLEFRAPIPPGSRTIGVFGAGRFIERPQGRHDFYAEVWTAPANITDGDAQLPENWREGQRCLASAHQMALVTRPGANNGGGQGSEKSRL